MNKHIPLAISKRFSCIELIKTKSINYIFCGIEEGEAKIIRVRPYPTKVFQGIGGENIKLLSTQDKLLKVQDKEWFPAILEHNIFIEEDTTYVVVIENEYVPLIDYRSGKVMDNIDIDKVVTNISQIWLELKSLNLYHNDIAIRNICYDQYRDRYILIDYENISNEPDNFSPTILREELNRIYD